MTEVNLSRGGAVIAEIVNRLGTEACQALVTHITNSLARHRSPGLVPGATAGSDVPGSPFRISVTVTGRIELVDPQVSERRTLQ